MDTPLSKSVSIGVRSVNGYVKNEPDVFIPKSFPEVDSDGKEVDPLWIFKPSEIRYLDALHRGEDPEKAIAEAGLTQQHITWLLKRKKARDYLGQLLRQKIAVQVWTQDKWLNEGIKVWEGKITGRSREQMEAWKELGARIAPKPEKSNGGSERPQIVINLGLAESAIKRQEIIDASIIKGT